jgi:phage terminase Nu1 subunit (DNA packaging protein)
MGDTTAALDSMAANRKGALMKLDNLAYFSGFSVSTLHAMIDSGLPIAKGGGSPGRPLLIDCAVFINWIIKRERERVVKELTGSSLASQSSTNPDGQEGSLPDYQAQPWKMRQGNARARMLEIEMAKMEGALVEIGAVEIIFAQIVATARARMLALPSRTAPLCAVSGDIIEVRRILEDAVREILEELAAVKPAELMDGKEEMFETLGERE